MLFVLSCGMTKRTRTKRTLCQRLYSFQKKSYTAELWQFAPLSLLREKQRTMIRIVFAILIIGALASLIVMALKGRIVYADKIYRQSRKALADEGYRTEKVEGLNYMWIDSNPVIYSIDPMEDINLLRLRFYMVEEFDGLEDVNREGMVVIANSLNLEYGMSFFIDFDEPNSISMAYEARIRNIGDFMAETKRFLEMHNAAEDYVKLSIPALIEEFPLAVDNERIGFKIAR